MSTVITTKLYDLFSPKVGYGMAKELANTSSKKSTGESEIRHHQMDVSFLDWTVGRQIRVQPSLLKK